MKKLSELLRELPGDLSTTTTGDVNISHITANSQTCREGSLFVATEGATSHSKDGHDFIDDALARGASAVMHRREFAESLPTIQVPCSDPKLALGHLCESFWDHPSRKLHVIGITGTNGKTSTSFFLHSILKKAGYSPKVMGTLGMGDPEQLVPLTNTTMNPEFISEHLARMHGEGVTHVIMEVSSHALALNRVEAINFSMVALTNVTHDHLDFHETLENYINAKARLFFELASANAEKILPMDHPFGSRVNSLQQLFLWRDDDDSALKNIFGFQQKNASLAAAIAQKLHIENQTIIDGINHCAPIPGRLQCVDTQHPIKVIVDYAHTPDALQRVLSSITGRIILIFGCGGDRDVHKRPLMGRIAEQYAHEIIVTDDNPRTEDPELIRTAIVAGMKEKHRASVIADRQRAIAEGIRRATSADTVVIAGKGHETYQIYGTTTKYFSDVDEAKKILEGL